MYLHPNTIHGKQVSNYFYYWIYLHIIFIIILILACAFYKIEKKIVYTGYYENQQIHMIVDKNFFERKTDRLLIQEKNYQYQVDKINIIAYEEGKASLWEVWITLDLPDNWRIENNQFQLSFIKEEATILNFIIKNIKKGMNL